MSCREFFRCGTVLLSLLLAGCQSNPSRPDASAQLHSGYRPAVDTDEAGLWLVMDRSEEDLKTSGSLIVDQNVNAYLHEVICRLAQDLCADVRVYLVRVPYFNASMAPNGVMQVWSGLLLRADNEAQLAYILGHELAHYRYQHSLQMFRQAKSTANVLAPFQVVTSAGGVGFVGSFAELAAVGSLMKFSRDHEREADDGGFEMMVAAGYDPREAAKTWEGLLDERDALGEDAPGVFLSTHPSSEERVESLNTKAAAVLKTRSRWDTGADRYNEVVEPLRFGLLRDELRLRQFPATQILLDRLSETDAPAAEIHYFQAELFSATAQDKDLSKAEQAYRESLSQANAPAQAYRELAMIYMKSERSEQAVPLFRAYLEQNPDAFDRNMVKAYIQRIHSKETSQ